MKEIRCYLPKILAVALCLSAVPWNFHARAVTADEDVVIASIRARAEPMYAKYIGVESKRETESKLYDAKTGELLNTYHITVIRKDYFRKRPEYRTLKYVKDGRDLPPEEYNYRTRDPVHLLFDADSDSNYTAKINGMARVDGRACYEILIIPKKKTPRHLSGKAYCDAATLELHSMEGTVAKLPLGVRRVYMRLFFKAVGDAVVISRGTFIFEVHIPLFYPNKKFVNTFTSTDINVIPK